MSNQSTTSKKLVRDIFISIFLYALPVLLMLLSFYITGERPWQNSASNIDNSQTK